MFADIIAYAVFTRTPPAWCPLDISADAAPRNNPRSRSAIISILKKDPKLRETLQPTSVQ